MKKSKLAFVILLSSAIVWGCAFVAQVLGSRYLDAFTMNAARFFLGGICLIPVFLLFEKEKSGTGSKKQMLLACLVCGAFLFGGSALQQFGVGLTENPGKSAFLSGLYTVLTPLIAGLILRKKVNWKVYLSAVIAGVGLYFLCQDGEGSFSFGAGEWILLASALLWALHILTVDHFARNCSPIRFSSGQFLVCSALNLGAAFLFGNPSLIGVRAAIFPILYCGVISVGFGFTGQVVGQKISEDPSRSAILLSTESLFSSIAGVIWNALPTSEELKVEASLNFPVILGGIFIFTAIVLSQLPDHSPK